MTGMSGDEGPELGPSVLLHAEVYRTLRWRLATGKIAPGVGLSTRNLAEELGVSQMPVREALGRLSAEGAIEIRSRRKIIITPMTPERFVELLRCRLLLEPELAKCALARIDGPRCQYLREADARVKAALLRGDYDGCREANYDFHFALYRAHRETTLSRLVEILWLQFGPYSRLVSEGSVEIRKGHHDLAIAAIERRDEAALAVAIQRDIEEGMGLIGRCLQDEAQSY